MISQFVSSFNHCHIQENKASRSLFHNGYDQQKTNDYIIPPNVNCKLFCAQSLHVGNSTTWASFAKAQVTESAKSNAQSRGDVLFSLAELILFKETISFLRTESLVANMLFKKNLPLCGAYRLQNTFFFLRMTFFFSR